MASRIREHDWAATPLGPAETWPQSLRTAVDMVLAMPGPANVLWGPAHIQIYNDAYIAIAKDRHPGLLGRSAAEGWPEVHAAVLAPVMDAAFAGRATRIDDLSAELQGPDGRLEDRAFDATWVPIRDEAGAVGGALEILVEVTDRRHAQAALRESEARHRLLIESWTQAVWETDADGVVVADSPSWRAHTGQALDEWLGYGWLDAIHPDDRAYAERQWREAVAACGVVNAEFRLRAPDGSWRWTNVRAAPVLDAEGRIEKWAGMNVDIDARKRSEDALRASEKRYHSLFNAIDAGFCTFEMIFDEAGQPVDFRYIDVNDGFEGQTGRRPTRGQTMRETFPEAHHMWLDLYAEVSRTGKPQRFVDYVGGLDRWYSVYVFRIQELGQHCLGALFTDVTEQKRAEEALRQSEEKYHTLFQSIDEGFCLLEYVDDPHRTLDYRWLEVNEAFERHTGLTGVVGKLLSEVSPDTEDFWQETYAEVARTGVARRVENHHEETGRWYDVFISRVGGEGSRQICLVFNDTTERKRAEAELREREERQAFLLKLSDALRGEADAHRIEQMALEMLADQLSADRAYITTSDYDTGKTVVSAEAQRTELPPLTGIFRHSDFPESARRVNEGTLVITDIGTDAGLSEQNRASIEAVGIHALIGVGLRRGVSDIFWTLAVAMAEPRRWTPGEVLLVEEAAERILAATERSGAEEALRGSEEKYRSLFEAMDEGFAICELVRDSSGRAVDYRYVEVNPAVVRHVGISPEALQGRLASETFSNLDPWLLATYANVVDAGRSIVADHHFAHVDRWLHINVFPRGGDCVAAVYSDVSERKRAEQTLRDSEERQAFLLRFTDAIRSEPSEQALIERAVRMLAEELVVDRAYATRHFPAQDFTNVVFEVRGPGLVPLPAILRFSDFPEAGRQTFQQTLVYEDTANDQSLTDADKASLAAMGVGAFLSRPLRRDGSPIFALGVVSTLPRRWTPAEIALIEEATERTWDAAERARAEAALRESEEQYAALFAASPAPFLILRPDAPHFTIEDVNDAYLAATMRTREDLVGRAMFDAFPDNPDDPAANGESNLRAALERALVSRRFELMDVQKYDIARPDGTFEERWWKPANSPVVDVNGNVVAIIHHVADITAEHRAVEALRANEERLRKVINAETVGVVFFDLAGGIYEANDAFLSMVGHTREELEAGEVRYQRLTPPEWRWRDEKTIAELKATGRAGPFEKEYMRKDGTRIWILCADKILDAHTAVEFIIDVTERKRADAALQQSEERFRHFGEASQDILWMRDAETLQWRYLTPAFETIYGLSRAEAMGGDNYRGWLDLVVPEDRDHADQSIARVRAGEHVTFEYRIRRPSDGAIRWLRNTDFPIRNAAGDVVLFGGTGHDFTAVRETERQLQTLMEGIPQLVWRSHDEGRWTWSSPQWQAFTGQSLEQSLDRGWLDAVHPNDREAAMQAWAGANASGNLDVEYRVRRAADDTYLWHHTRSLPVRDRDGHVQEWLGTSTDVQQLKELQERQSVMVAELQHRTRNLIAVVRSIAGQTMTQTGPTEAFRTEFNHRLEALARVQGLLSRAEEEPITIERLIRMELDALGAFREAGERITLAGPPIRIRNSVVQTLALGLHELATNARKYGALSTPHGQLNVTWTVRDADGAGRQLALVWAETGSEVPKDSAPERRGYGRELIEQALPYALSAQTTYELTSEGVLCTIDLPLEKAERRRRRPQ